MIEVRRHLRRLENEAFATIKQHLLQADSGHATHELVDRFNPDPLTTDQIDESISGHEKGGLVVTRTATTVIRGRRRGRVRELLLNEEDGALATIGRYRDAGGAAVTFIHHFLDPSFWGLQRQVDAAVLSPRSGGLAVIRKGKQ